MNYQYHTNMPGSNHPNPLIIFSNMEKPYEENMKNKFVQKDMPLKKDNLYIILADDDADDRELFTEVIEETGLNVKLDCAEDGNELMAILSSQPKELPHMIFLDLNMPNRNGKECLKMIRASEKLKHIPVIIYSTSSSPLDIEETFETGANLYVRKPSSYRDLLSMARSVLQIDWEKHQPKSSKANFMFSQKTDK